MSDDAGSMRRWAGWCGWALASHARSRNGANISSTCSIPKATSSTFNRSGVATSVQIVFDCADPDKLATFWAAALLYKKQDPPSAIADPDGTGPRISFQRVPERKSVKNPVHLDLNIGGGCGTPQNE